MFALVHFAKSSERINFKVLFSQYFSDSVFLTNNDCYLIELNSNKRDQSKISLQLFHFFYQQENETYAVLLSSQKLTIDIEGWSGFFVSSEIYYDLTTIAKWINIGIQYIDGKIVDIYKLEQTNHSKTKLVGREKELNSIDLFINKTENNTLIMFGESGIGKTSLLSEIYITKKHIIRDKFNTVNTPQWWICSVTDPYFSENSNSVHSPEQIAEKFIHLFTELKTSNYLILLDDIQWADEHSLRIIKAFLKKDTLPFKLILSSRPSIKIESILEKYTNVARIDLKRLSERSCYTWINQTYPNKLNENQCRKLYSITNGHALLLSELTRSLVRNNRDITSSHKIDNKLLKIGSEIAYSLLINSYDIPEQIKRPLRILCELDQDFDEEFINQLKCLLGDFPSITELLKSGLIEKVNHSNYNFNHQLVKEALKKHIKLTNTTDVFNALAQVFSNQERYSEAAKVYKKLGLQDLYSKSCYKNVVLSYKKNQLSTVIDYASLFLKEAHHIKKHEDKKEQVLWYHGVSLAGLGYIHKAYESLGNFLKSKHLSPKKSQFFRMLQILFIPNCKTTIDSSFNSPVIKEQTLIALRYRLENGWVESLSKNSLSDAINYYKLDKTIVTHSKYKAEGSLYFGLAIAGNVSKSIGRRIIRDSLIELRKLKFKQIFYYKFALLHYRLGTKKWISSNSLIKNIYSCAKNVDASTIGKTRLDEVIYLILLDQRAVAITRCNDSIEYLETFKVDWIYQVFLTVKAHLLMHDKEYDKALFTLDKITNESVKKLHSYLSVKSTLLLLKGDINASESVMNLATTCLGSVKFNDYSRASYLADTLLTYHILNLSSKTNLYKNGLKVLKQHIFTNAKFFECYKPIKHLHLLLIQCTTNNKPPKMKIKKILEHSSKFHYLSILNYFNLLYPSEAIHHTHPSPCQIELIKKFKINLPDEY